MGLKAFLDGNNQLLDNAGNPLVGGKVYFFTPGAATPKPSYPTSADAAAGTNPLPVPVVMNGSGRPQTGGSVACAIWIDGNADVRVDTSLDVTVRTELSINPEGVGVSSTGDSTIPNGSFEEVDLAGKPADWVLTLNGGTATVDEVTPGHGKRALKLTGGAQALSAAFHPVDGLRGRSMSWLLKTDGNSNNIFRIYWYDEDQDALAGADEFSDIYSASSGGALAYTAQLNKVPAPATARFYKIQLSGVVAGSADAASAAWFDGIESEPSFVRISGLTEALPMLLALPVGVAVADVPSAWPVGNAIYSRGAGGTVGFPTGLDTSFRIWHSKTTVRSHQIWMLNDGTATPRVFIRHGNESGVDTWSNWACLDDTEPTRTTDVESTTGTASALITPGNSASITLAAPAGAGVWWRLMSVGGTSSQMLASGASTGAIREGGTTISVSVRNIHSSDIILNCIGVWLKVKT